MLKVFLRWLSAAGVIAGGLATAATLAVGGAGPVSSDGDTPTLAGGSQPLPLSETQEQRLDFDYAFTSRRMAGSTPISLDQAGEFRGAAAKNAKKLRKENIPPGPSTFTGAWRQIGANPIVQVTRGSGTFTAMSGRVGALAIRPSNGKFILGAAQGGIWLYDSATGTWSPKTSDQTTQAIGALAIAPSDDSVVYAGTGEGALSGDSYFGNGVLKSTDGGNTWTHISDDKYFQGVAMSRLAVDPTDKNHVFAAVLRGRGGARRVSPTEHTKYGVWESKDGGVDWKRIQQVRDSLGATDLRLDPQNPKIIYTSFWGDAIYRSTDGGKHWATIMSGLPAADYAGGLTRFAIAISHPSPAAPAVLYTGFDWQDADGAHPSRVFKSSDGGDNWSILPPGTTPNKVEDYCGGQCFYDNVIEVDPTNPNVVFAAGQFDYGIGSGGVFRSDDGGATWKNLGWDQHPDFHALAFNPANTAQVLVGSDGGVWSSNDRGGRPNASDPLQAVTWVNLNGTVNPASAGIIARSNLAIAQFTSIATVPQIPPTAPGSGRFWGGTQDNGTLRKTGGTGQQWFDVASGDGGQVLVDHTADACVLGPACYVYGTYFNVSPYRYTDGGNFFTNQFLRNGLNTSDRSDFYPPFVLNRNNVNQLFFGTYRLYRIDNAKAPSVGDIRWKTISGDLTSGCVGTAPNGARNCTISAIGVGGGQAVYTGSLDGLIYMSTDAQVNDDPTWRRVDKDRDLPERPVSAFAVDRSNYRVAYAAFNGFNAATKGQPGHVFRTWDGGKRWTDISGNLPDNPVNSLILDPAYPNTLYAGTDVGAFVTYNGGTDWFALGTGFPLVAIWQLDLDPAHRVLAAGTHGRGAYDLIDETTTVPGLVLSKVDAGNPVGPSSNITYTLTLKNIGNAPATGVTITDPVPDNTSFVSADSGGTESAGTVTWSGLTVPAGGSVSVHFTVSIAAALKKHVDSIVNDGLRATAEGGFSATGSPFVTPIAPPYGVTIAPATQQDGGRVGTSVPYLLTVRNVGFNSDSYTLSATNAWTTTFFDATCTTPLSTVGPVAAGATATVCAKVAVPAGASDGATNTGTVTATSVGDPAVSASASLKTIAVVNRTLLVDNDDNAPNVQSYYSAALTAAGITFTTWDLATDRNLPVNYTKAFTNVVWFAGNSYPGPVLPHEATLKAFLDNGGRLFMSGQDILDQGAGTTPFVHDYLHIAWDGSETQNDKATANVHGVAGNPVTNGIGAVPIDHSVLGAAFEDKITPINGALNAFTDDASDPDALSFGGTYKVVFLAFGLESYGTAAQKADLINRTFTFFGP
jgi:uncharacterized repeat protein (TIGR01451 family)